MSELAPSPIDPQSDEYTALRTSLASFVHMLLQAGMHIEDVVKHGFEHARTLFLQRMGTIMSDPTVNEDAAKLILDVSRDLGITLAQQKATATQTSNMAATIQPPSLQNISPVIPEQITSAPSPTNHPA